MENNEKTARLNALKQLLANTDYVTLKFYDGAITMTEYSVIQEQRTLWRNELSEIEDLLSEEPKALPELEMVRAVTLEKIDKACTQTIYNGVDVETSIGLKHFNMSEHDQANLNGIATAISNPDMLQAIGADPAQGIWYKADGDGETHRYWTVEDFIKLLAAVFKHKNEQLTYCDDLKSYVRTLETKEEIEQVYYGMPIPGAVQHE